ncbi:hypothetical protein ACIBH1_09190 [Nonomuraea sp. NPDC050663]|uniref:hypothetical protein n=1 Tax=Nonomuraea sp. NPDC050663 TaxID=3364370 RepID=UPI0037AA6BFE
MAQEGHGLFVTYFVSQNGGIPPNSFQYRVTTLPHDARLFTCTVFDGERIVWHMTTRNGTTDSDVLSLGGFTGDTMTFRLNYEGSGVDDVVIPLTFPTGLRELSQQFVHFTWAANSTPFGGQGGPLVQLDPSGSPVILSYNVPEPTSYRGRHIVELDFPLAYFVEPGGQHARSAPPTEPSNGPPVIGEEAPLIGSQTPDRADQADMTTERITAAFQTARTTGYFDQRVFPNVGVGLDEFSRVNARNAIADLQLETVVEQLQNGYRLTIYRSAGGRYTYRFIPAPKDPVPRILLVEYYRLSSFPARYGAGRTIKTFSLLPGERTRIRVSTYKRSAQSLLQATSIIDSTSDETESEFERSVIAERSSKYDSTETFEYHAEAEAEASATWGWGKASASASGGVSGSSSIAREEFAKGVSNAVSHNAARASTKRDVQVDTSLDVKLEAGEEQAIERDLTNINVSRTLNFVFRQMNQEYITLLHLVDVRVAFFNGYAESRFEVPLSDLQRLLTTFVKPERHDEVRSGLVRQLSTIMDYREDPVTDLLQQVAPPSKTAGAGYLRINPARQSSYDVAGSGLVLQVPGVIVSADSHVMRTDGVLVDTFIGRGDGLDDYSKGLQQEAVRNRKVENALRELEAERVNLALQIIRDGDVKRGELFEHMFPRVPVVNQIGQAGSILDGRQGLPVSE